MFHRCYCAAISQEYIIIIINIIIKMIHNSVSLFSHGYHQQHRRWATDCSFIATGFRCHIIKLRARSRSRTIDHTITFLLKWKKNVHNENETKFVIFFSNLAEPVLTCFTSYVNIRNICTVMYCYFRLEFHDISSFFSYFSLCIRVYGY